MNLTSSKPGRKFFKKLAVFSAFAMIFNMSFSGVFSFTGQANAGIADALDQQCAAAGFGYAVAEWKCDENNCGSGLWVNTVEVTPGSSVTGDCDAANWGAGGSGADGIVAEAGSDPKQIIAGISGAISKVNDKFSRVLFCGSYDAPVCGNGAVEGGEQCDDGNTAGGDGCSPTCQTECGGPICGDGAVNQASEQCDEGADNGAVCAAAYGGACSYCSNTCQTTEIAGPFCGDGVKNGSEECDDGNTADGDGCQSSCAVPAGPSYGAISGYKYGDADGLASTTADWTGLQGWAINLFDSLSTSTPIATTTTDNAGYYEFTALLAGDYSLTENMLAGWTQLSAPAALSLSGGQASAGNNFVNYLAPVCGDGIKNGQEACDGGANNGTVCAADYGGACSYCSNTCQIMEITGPFCGDKVVNGQNEQCDGVQDNCTGECKHSTQGGGGGAVIIAAPAPAEVKEPILMIDKTVSNEFANPGDEVEYTVVLKNAGDLAALAVKLSDTLPAGFKYSEDGKTAKIWDIGDIGPGESKVTVYKAVIGEAVKSGIYANIAEATASNHGKVSDITNIEVRAVEVLGEEFAETGFNIGEFLILASLAILAAGTALGLRKKYELI